MTPEDFDRLVSTVGQAEASHGPVLTAYKDTNGVWTIGYGTNLQELEIDIPTAERWLREKLSESEHECRIRFAWFPALSPARQMAICEMVYNLGMTRFLKFKKMIRALERGDFETARAEALDSQWRRDVKEARANRIADAIRNG